MPTDLFVNIDVDDIEAAATFYTAGLGLHVGRRLGDDFLELLGAPVPIYLLEKAKGSAAHVGASSGRRYGRHWTPVHLDFVVPDIEAAIARALAAGAKLESDVQHEPYGLLALLADPFGHGFCFLQLEYGGYDAISR